MVKVNPMLLIDYYKAVHAEMLPKGITKSVSYFTLQPMPCFEFRF